jgi:hypothetical protein
MEQIKRQTAAGFNKKTDERKPNIFYTMRKVLFYWFAFLLILLAMTSCKSKANLVKSEITTDSIIETVKDTVFEVAKDSSSYVAELQCINGKVIVKSVTNTTSGRKLQAPKVIIKDNILTVDCTAQAEKIFASWKEKFIKSFKQIEVPVITNELTWWQETQIYIGRILSIILMLWLLILMFISKFKKK